MALHPGDQVCHPLRGKEDCRICLGAQLEVHVPLGTVLRSTGGAAQTPGSQRYCGERKGLFSCLVLPPGSLAASFPVVQAHEKGGCAAQKLYFAVFVQGVF